jgi:predicted acetyltransferase
MDFKLEKVNEEEKEILKNLLEFYLYEFNVYYEDDVNQKGRFDFIDVEPYFKNNKNKAIFIKVNNNYAGFVLISDKNETKCIEEFWIMPKYRKGFFAFQVLKEVIEEINGKIEFIIINQNERWMKVLKYLINKHYKVISEENIKKWEVYDFTKFIIDCNVK